MVHKTPVAAVAAISLLLTAGCAFAHFGVITPSDDIVTQEDAKKLALEVKFIHPMEGPYMEMEKPKQFGVMVGGEKTDLLASLAAKKGKSPEQTESFHLLAGRLSDQKTRGLYLLPRAGPVLGTGRGCLYHPLHQGLRNALGLEEGWDQPVGLETEIVR
jgi:cobalt/nickel transport protein